MFVVDINLIDVRVPQHVKNVFGFLIYSLHSSYTYNFFKVIRGSLSCIIVARRLKKNDEAIRQQYFSCFFFRPPHFFFSLLLLASLPEIHKHYLPLQLYSAIDLLI